MNYSVGIWRGKHIDSCQPNRFVMKPFFFKTAGGPSGGLRHGLISGSSRVVESTRVTFSRVKIAPRASRELESTRVTFTRMELFTNKATFRRVEFTGESVDKAVDNAVSRARIAPSLVVTASFMACSRSIADKCLWASAYALARLRMWWAASVMSLKPRAERWCETMFVRAHLSVVKERGCMIFS